MKSRFVSILLATALVGASVAQAAANFAEIGSIQGKVLVNQGHGFVALADGAALKAGDRVLVGKESGVVIAYANGCSVAVDEPKVLTIAKVAPCKTGATVAMTGSSLIAPVADLEAPAAVGFPLPLLLLGGAGAGLATILIINNNKGPTVSPGV